MSVLTIGIIVKNEINNLPACLDAIKPLRDAVPCTVVITDTGSTDGTDKVAEARADIFKRFAWIDDFAAARNTTLEGIDSEWYMYLDADEHCIDPAPLVEFFTSGAYKKYDSASIIIHNLLSDGFENEFTHIRLVKTEPGMAFTGIIHEYLTTKRDNTAKLNVVFKHDGYSDRVLAQKEIRNTSLLKKQLAETADPLHRSRQLFQLGETVYRNLPDDAVKYWEEAVMIASSNGVYAEFKYFVLARLEMFYYTLSDFDKTLETHERYVNFRAREKGFSRIIYTDIEDAIYTGFAAARRSSSSSGDDETAVTALDEYFRLYSIYHADKDQFAADNGVYPAANVTEKSYDKAVHFYASSCLKANEYAKALARLPNPQVSTADMLRFMDFLDDFTRFPDFAALPLADEVAKAYLPHAVNTLHLADVADAFYKATLGNDNDFATISRYLQTPFDCEKESLNAKKAIIEFINQTTDPEQLVDLAILTDDYIDCAYQINDPDFYPPFLRTAMDTLAKM